MSLSIKKGDYVKVISGKDRGKMAQVTAVDLKSGRVTIEGKGITPVKKALKARKASDKGGIVSILRTVDASNVMPVCAACGKTTRVKNAIVDGKKVRMCKCGSVLETKKVATKEEKKAKATVRKKTKKTDAEAPVAVNEATEVTEATATEAAPVEE